MALAGAPPSSFYTTVDKFFGYQEEEEEGGGDGNEKLMRVQLEKRLYTPKKALQDLQLQVLCHLI